MCFNSQCGGWPSIHVCVCVSVCVSVCVCMCVCVCDQFQLKALLPRESCKHVQTDIYTCVSIHHVHMYLVHTVYLPHNERTMSCMFTYLVHCVSTP